MIGLLPALLAVAWALALAATDSRPLMMLFAVLVAAAIGAKAWEDLR